MKLLAIFVAVLGMLLILCGNVGMHLDADPLYVHSCNSEGMLMVIAAMVFDHVMRDKS